jgi:enterochelin esterase-like enzyme
MQRHIEHQAIVFNAYLIEFNATKRRNTMSQKHAAKSVTGGQALPVPGKVYNVRRRSMRLLVLLTLYNAGERGADDEFVRVIIQSAYPDATVPEVRRQLAYLAKRQLVNVHKETGGRWIAYLTCYGADMIEAAKVSDQWL